MPPDSALLRHTHSRRAFLKRIALSGLGTSRLGSPLPLLFSSTAASQSKASQAANPLFVEVPPSSSGISWRHVNGRSSQYYLPETTGAGCAFIDYDGDGWMDIYLVNSGHCDFYDPSPPLRNALYRNNRNGTFTDVTTRGRCSRRRIWDGRGRRGF